jgi:hypothetical protein
VGLIGAVAQSLIGGVAVGAPMQLNDDLDLWERRLEAAVETDTWLPPTDRDQIVRARRGQGLFKDRVMQIEQRCRVTHVTNPVHLIASHCKQWRDSDNEERLNGENGLLLTPSIDHLFDRGFIGFEGDGPIDYFAGRSQAVACEDGDRSKRRSERRAVHGRAAAVPGVSPGPGSA